jgi:hypothetical protein
MVLWITIPTSETVQIKLLPTLIHIPVESDLKRGLVAFLTLSLGIFFSKDRIEEVIEVEEDPDVEYIAEAREHVKLMTQGQWMKGCPEGGEQSFLFGLYSELSDGVCRCPQGCTFSVSRKKSDFFAIFASIFLACFPALFTNGRP